MLNSLKDCFSCKFCSVMKETEGSSVVCNATEAPIDIFEPNQTNCPSFKQSSEVSVEN